MRSAILFRMTLRSAGVVFFHDANAFHPASTARSMSCASPRATSQNGLPVTGVMFSKYSPEWGSTHSPPM